MSSDEGGVGTLSRRVRRSRSSCGFFLAIAAGVGGVVGRGRAWLADFFAPATGRRRSAFLGGRGDLFMALDVVRVVDFGADLARLGVADLRRAA